MYEDVKLAQARALVKVGWNRLVHSARTRACMHVYIQTCMHTPQGGGGADRKERARHVKHPDDPLRSSDTSVTAEETPL